jgi:ribonuclease P protein component
VVVVHVDTPITTDNAPAPTGEAQLPVRAGFVVPKTVGKAVDRNKVRRRLRHLIRDRLTGLPPGTAVVVRALPGAADRGYPDLADDLDAALVAARNRRPRRPSREGT